MTGNRSRTENGNPLPRRAGISSFGVGGTNAHGILEELPQPEPSPSANRSFILPLSAKKQDSLDAYTGKLAEYLGQSSEVSIADTAYTFQTGRQAFDHRRFVVCGDMATAAKRLGDLPAILTGSGKAPKEPQTPVFMFTGQGSQHVGMGRKLYESNAIFKHNIDLWRKAGTPAPLS